MKTIDWTTKQKQNIYRLIIFCADWWAHWHLWEDKRGSERGSGRGGERVVEEIVREEKVKVGEEVEVDKENWIREGESEWCSERKSECNGKKAEKCHK